MKAVIISDTHSQGKLSKILSGLSADVLIHAGDFTARGTITDVIDFNEQLGEVKDRFTHILLNAGNHDRIVQQQPELSKQRLTNGKLLIDEAVIIEGKKFYFSPWTPEFCNWAFMYKPEDAERTWARIPEDTHVLVTHGPRFGVLDVTENGDCVGCPELGKRIFDLRIPVHCHGHIHEGYGVFNHSSGVHINASICNAEYKPLNAPIVIDI